MKQCTYETLLRCNDLATKVHCSDVQKNSCKVGMNFMIIMKTVIAVLNNQVFTYQSMDSDLSLPVQSVNIEHTIAVI